MDVPPVREPELQIVIHDTPSSTAPIPSASSLQSLNPPSSGFFSFIRTSVSGMQEWGGQILSWIPFWNSSSKPPPLPPSEPVPPPAPAPITLQTPARKEKPSKPPKKLEPKQDFFTFVQTWGNLLLTGIKRFVLSIFKFLRMIFTIELE